MKVGLEKMRVDCIKSPALQGKKKSRYRLKNKMYQNVRKKVLISNASIAMKTRQREIQVCCITAHMLFAQTSVVKKSENCRLDGPSLS